MTASKHIKAKGLPSIEAASRLSHTPVSTINKWYISRRDRLDVLLDGALLRYIDEQLLSSGISEQEFSQKVAKLLRG